MGFKVIYFHHFASYSAIIAIITLLRLVYEVKA